jgi:2TM domain
LSERHRDERSSDAGSGESVPNDPNERRDEARRWVRRKRIFYTVAGIYLCLSLMWFAIDLLDDSSGFRFYWPMLGTGVGVLMTGTVFGGVGGLFGKDWERRQAEKYLRQMNDRGTGPDARPRD